MNFIENSANVFKVIYRKILNIFWKFIILGRIPPWETAIIFFSFGENCGKIFNFISFRENCGKIIFFCLRKVAEKFWIIFATFRKVIEFQWKLRKYLQSYLSQNFIYIFQNLYYFGWKSAVGQHRPWKNAVNCGKILNNFGKDFE